MQMKSLMFQLFTGKIYGVGSFEEQPDGMLLFEHEYSDDEGLILWMLSCRGKVTVRSKNLRIIWGKEHEIRWFWVACRRHGEDDSLLQGCSRI